LAELQEALDLPEPPNRIECYDISNTQGDAAAGSMVVFEQGAPNKNLYRKFNIKSVQGQDDFASMEEVLERRFRRWQIANEQAGKPGGKRDKSFGFLPDLLIVDGGKGQLNRAVEVLKRYELGDRIPAIGLAKENEELYMTGRIDPVILPRRSQGLFLIQRIRDEAHRFALRQHRKKRQMRGLASRLDGIRGIGPAKRKALLQTFGSLDGLRKAEVDELTDVRGITRELAERLKEEL